MTDTPDEIFEALHREHYRAVLAYARRRVPADEADDVVAETFTTAWRNLRRVPSDPLPWLLGVARNVILHQRRAHARRDALARRLGEESVRIQPNCEPIDHGVLRALAGLAEADREILMLVGWDGRSIKEAAQIMNTTHVAARARLHRARRRLSSSLGMTVGNTPAKERA